MPSHPSYPCLWFSDLLLTTYRNFSEVCEGIKRYTHCTQNDTILERDGEPLHYQGEIV